MTDEHDPYRIPNSPENTRPERRSGDVEIEVLRLEVAHLKGQITALKADEKEDHDRIAELSDEIQELKRTLTLGKGFLGGLVFVCGVFGIFVVDSVKEVLAHIHDYLIHHMPGGPDEH